MKNKVKKLRIFIYISFVIEVILLVVGFIFFKKYFTYLCLGNILLDMFLVVLSLSTYSKLRNDLSDKVTNILSDGVKEALIISNSGMIVYDEEYRITYVSSLLEARNINVIGEKVVRAFPGSDNIFSGNNKTIIRLNDKIYQLYRSMTSQVIYINDITDIATLGKTYKDEQLVLGLVNFDNYIETIQFEDEKRIAEINYEFRNPVLEYLSKYNAIIRMIKEDRYIVMINNINFEKMVEDKFSILNNAHQVSEKLGTNISLSMAFSCGSADLTLLDDNLNETMELVLGRGGDQVGVKYQNKSVEFYGHSSDAKSKVSKVKARVIALSIRDLIKNCKNVIVVPHTNADFDAIGACIGVSKMVKAYNRNSYLLLDNIKIESQARNTYINNAKELSEGNIIDEKAALELIKDNTIVIVVDHHSYDQTAASELVKASNRVVMIDHHRRKEENRIKAILVYNESSASSSVELITELMQYQGTKIDLNEIEATYMYTGLLVDTDNLTKRTSSRTFEACAYLRNMGANITLSNEWLKESYDNFIAKTDFMRYSQELSGNIVIAAYPEAQGMVEHTMCAIVANELIGVKDIEAAFTIALTNEDTISISARSNGKVNVQLIMEQLGGGGHFNMAATKIKGSTVERVKEILIKAIDNYKLGGQNNESDTTK